MVYREFTDLGIKVSTLGMGCMRLPFNPGENAGLNREEGIKIIRAAIDGGVNYIDTAYSYSNEENEILTGLALRGGYRERVYIATKLPCWKVEKYEDMERLLDEQLEKLQVSYIDFYLLHSLNLNSFRKMKELGYAKFLDKAIADGKIKYPSFSFHDNAEAFIEIVDDYPWKMAQVQFNILDDDRQATLEGIKYAAGKNIGIVVMEPLRGGALANNTPQNVMDVYNAFPEKRSPVEWAMRYVYDFPEVMCILSGMNTIEQVEDNLRIFASAHPSTMTPQEHKLIKDVKQAYMARIKTGCTDCKYCMPCPQGVKIPDIFQAYDQAMMFDNISRFNRRYANIIKDEADATMCVECGACEEACPQSLEIISLLKEVHAEYKA